MLEELLTSLQQAWAIWFCFFFCGFQFHPVGEAEKFDVAATA